MRGSQSILCGATLSGTSWDKYRTSGDAHAPVFSSMASLMAISPFDFEVNFATSQNQGRARIERRKD